MRKRITSPHYHFMMPAATGSCEDAPRSSLEAHHVTNEIKGKGDLRTRAQNFQAERSYSLRFQHRMSFLHVRRSPLKLSRTSTRALQVETHQTNRCICKMYLGQFETAFETGHKQVLPRDLPSKPEPHDQSRMVRPVSGVLLKTLKVGCSTCALRQSSDSVPECHLVPL